jgi:hypothetical protein
VSIRKSAEDNQRHRRKLALRLAGAGSAALLVLVAVLGVVVSGLPSFGDGADPAPAPNGGGQEPVEPVAVEPVEVAEGRAHFEGEIAAGGAVVLRVNSGQGLLSVRVRFENPSFSGRVVVGDHVETVRRGGGDVFATVAEPGQVEVVVVADGDDGTPFAARIDHP